MHHDYDFENPSVELKVKKTLPRRYSPSDAEVTTTRGTTSRRPTASTMRWRRIDEYGAQDERRNADDQCARSGRGPHCSSSKRTRETIRTSEYLVLRRTTTSSSASTSRSRM